MKSLTVTSTLVVATAMLVAAGCGGSSSNGGNPDESAAKAAANSFISALKSGNATDLCGVISLPSSVTPATCVSSVQSSLSSNKFTGTATVANAAVSGDKAIVVTTGKFCLGKECVSNTDGSSGLPSGSTSFATAYAASASNSKSPDLNLIKTNGKWLIVEGSS